MSGPAPLSRGQLSELRRWARSLVDSRVGGDLEALAREIVPLADEADRLRSPGGAGAPGELELDALRLRAETLVENGAPDEVRAAARAVLLLCDDIARLHPAPEVARALHPPVPAEVAVRPARDKVTRRRRLVAGALVAVSGAALALVLVLRGGSSSLDAEGPRDALVSKEELAALSFSVAGTPADAARTLWALDGEPVDGRYDAARGRIVYRPRGLADGEHRVDVSRGGEGLDAFRSWAFTVDATPPAIRVSRASLETRPGAPYTLRGSVEPGTSLTVNGSRPSLDADGRFAVPFDRRPERAVILLARDPAGNVTDSRLVVGVGPRYPRNPVRAVHVSADGWAHRGLRSEILRLLDEKRINAVQIDLKDESGIVGWPSGVPLARRIGAERRIFDLKAAVDLLHARGARVIGRLVAFRDPVLSEWAWKNGRRELVVQTPSGDAYSGGYGGFTNFANAEVQRYNVDLAEAAAKLGVDDVLYDYVRRPDGPTAEMVVPGLEGDPADAVVGFLARSRDRLEPYGTFQGASVFGIAATRPHEIAQDVPAIGRVVDYVAPMLYPSHWGPYEYDIPDPNAEPYLIVRRSLEDFEQAVEGTGSRVVPWLQDFSLGREYGRKEVRAQIDATLDAGLDEFLLWDPEVTYTSAALGASARLPTVGTRRGAPGSSELVKLKASPAPDAPVRSGLAPNELGGVPVLMYHQLLAGGGSEYDLTPAEFRAELERLYREHYRPVTASAYLTGRMDVPRGATPVVLTFDDSTVSQAALLPDGRIDPDTMVGALLDFSREHPDFPAVGTFYVNRDPFGGGPDAARLARRLRSLGFELANHTYGHTRLDGLDAEAVQEEIVRGSRVITDLLPDAEVRSFALPFGIQPARPELALRGRWDGETYRFAGAFLAGAEPAPSPYAAGFPAAAAPRIRSDPGGVEYGSADWLDRLAAAPEQRFVSDGKPRRITFPAESAPRLDERYAARANPTG